MKKQILSLFVGSALLLGMVATVTAALTSESSATFGPGSLTTDSETGLSWLDLTFTTQYSKEGMLTALATNPAFAGFRMATLEEVNTFLQHAGVDTSLYGFTPANSTPILDLMALIGITGNNGNCGNGCIFDFSTGHVLDPYIYEWEGQTYIRTYAVSVAAYERENLDGTFTPVGRYSVGNVPLDNLNDSHGSWLVLDSIPPEEALQDLITEVVNLNIYEGISSSLDAKLGTAVAALDDLNENNDVAAVNTLYAFIKYVEAQKGNQISEQDAEVLILAAQSIIDALETP